MLDVKVLFLSEDAALRHRQAYGPTAAASGPAGDGQEPSKGGSGRTARQTPPEQTGTSTSAPTAALLPLVRARSTVRVSEAVMRKLTGLESVEGVEAVAELDLPPAMDLSSGGHPVCQGHSIHYITGPVRWSRGLIYPPQRGGTSDHTNSISSIQSL